VCAAQAAVRSREQARLKRGLDRCRQPAEKAARQARVVAEHDPSYIGNIRHRLDIASRGGSDNKKAGPLIADKLYSSFRTPRSGDPESRKPGALIWLDSGFALKRAPE
jgi:hypothetical protein